MSNATSVHTEETTGQTELIPSYHDLLVSSCRPEFEAALHLYEFVATPRTPDWSFRLLNCRTRAWFVRDKTSGLVYIASSACHLRWCPLCARAKARSVSKNVADFLRRRSDVRFLTLTLKHSSAPLSSQVDFLYSKFRYLRKDKQFRGYVTGGIWFFQIKFNKETNEWHPHLHCLITGKYIPQEWLARKWLTVTKTSNIVDIRSVKNAEEVAEYVARYVSSPCRLKDLPSEVLPELHSCFHQRRLSGSWGSMKGVRLSFSSRFRKEDSSYLGQWDTVTMSRQSDNNARAIWYSWKDKTPIPDGIDMSHLENFMNIGKIPNDVDLDVVENIQYQFW